MYFTDDSLLPENQPPLMITGAPYGPMWMPQDCEWSHIIANRAVSPALGDWSPFAAWIFGALEDIQRPARLSRTYEILP